MKKSDIERFVFFVCAIVLIASGSFLYGVFAQIGNLIPMPQLRYGMTVMNEVINPGDELFDTSPLRHKSPVKTIASRALQPGLLLVAEDVANRQTAVRVIDRSGRVIHEWRPLWSKIWPDSEGKFPPDRIPATGMYIHGIDILPDASIVANFEHLSTFKMDICGKVEWKLANLGHHSVHYSDDGTLWVTAEKYIPEGDTEYPDHVAPLRSWILQNLSTDGKVLRTIPVIDLLLKNGLEGLPYMSSTANTNPVVSGDTLHLNDVDTFPAGWKSDIFKPGDIMLSLRNISTIMVIDSKTEKLKFVSTGRVMRQHDPDFIPGDKISVFDNRSFTKAPNFGPPASSIVEIDAHAGKATTVISGAGEEPFFSNIMGVHQRLENGNILVMPSGEGRVLEFSKEGHLLWWYDNRVAPNKNRRMYMAMVLPPQMNEAFFRDKSRKCVN